MTRLPVMQPPRIKRKRDCGECFVCCIHIGVEALSKPRDVCCEYASSKGCGIYTARPQDCRGWKCAWLNDDDPMFKASDRPDKLGVMFWWEPNVNGRPALVATETREGGLDGERAKTMVREFSKVAPMVTRDFGGNEAIISEVRRG